VGTIILPLKRIEHRKAKAKIFWNKSGEKAIVHHLLGAADPRILTLMTVAQLFLHSRQGK
jgi:hypothetical protein